MMIFSLLDDVSLLKSLVCVNKAMHNLVCQSTAANDWLWLPRSRQFFRGDVELPVQLRLFDEYTQRVKKV